MRKVIQLGKVAYSGTRKINAVDIEIRLSEDGRLAISGNIWNGSHTDCVSCGQNLDQILKLFRYNNTVKKIHAIWKRWHLNDIRAGSPAQEELLRNSTFPKDYPNRDYYGWATNLLAENNLNPDPNYLHKGVPYRYGSAWLKEELPQDVIDFITSL